MTTEIQPQNILNNNATNVKPPASLYYRYAAATLDGLTVGFITLIAYILLSILGSSENNLLLNFVGTFIGVVYAVVLLINQQATWGKQYFKMKIESFDNQPITWEKAIKREVLGKFLSSIFLGIGFLWAVFDKRKQAWHDKIADTIVVETGLLSKGRRFVAFLLVFGLLILAIVGVIGVIILVTLNPLGQLNKAREAQNSTEEKMLNKNQENNIVHSEQWARAYDAGRVSGVQQMGRAVKAYYISNQNYPSLYNWSADLVEADELSKVPEGINYGSGTLACSSNLVNNTWCYNSNDNDAIVFAKLESQQRRTQCDSSSGDPYIMFSVNENRGGIVCSFTDPKPSLSYDFIK